MKFEPKKISGALMRRAGFAVRKLFVKSNRRKQKRQSTTALQDLAAPRCACEPAPASWSAAVLCRFGSFAFSAAFFVSAGAPLFAKEPDLSKSAAAKPRI